MFPFAFATLDRSGNKCLTVSTAEVRCVKHLFPGRLDRRLPLGSAVPRTSSHPSTPGHEPDRVPSDELRS